MKKYSSFIKKVLSLLLTAVFCCGMLAGCGEKEEDTSSLSVDQMDVGENTTLPGYDNISINSKNPDKDALTVFCTTAAYDMVRQAAQAWSMDHKEQKLEITCLDNQGGSYKERLQKVLSRMMAGDSADVFVVDDLAFREEDVTKICMANVFEDLKPYFESDAEWSWDGYNKNVIDSFEMEDRLTLMPLSYSIPFLLTEEGLMEESGFDLEKCETGKGLLQEMIDYTEHARNDSNLPPLFMSKGYLTTVLFDAMQMSPIDYDNRQVVWKEDTEEFLQLFREYYPIDQGKDIPNLSLTTVEKTGQHLQNGDFLFLEPLFDCEGLLSGAFTRIGEIGEFGTPTLVPIRSYDESGISAAVTRAIGITGSSKKKQDAYAFIKYMLSPGVQRQAVVYGESEYVIGDCPVYEKSLDAVWSKNTEDKAPKSVKEAYIALTHEVNHSYMICDQEGVALWDYFLAYLQGEESLENALEGADKRLKIYVTE